MNLLLLSNSSSPGQPYLGWARPLIEEFLPNEINQCIFIPFAAVTFSWDDYTDRVNDAWSGPPLQPIHRLSDPRSALQGTDLIVVGGGNTFQLVTECYQRDLMQLIQTLARNGLPFLGWSAGATLATATLKTTNDMPIVEPPSFQCLNLVPYQINPHFTRNVLSGHGGETRVDRLNEFIEANPNQSIIALPEGSGIRVTGTRHSLVGDHPAVLFRHGISERIIPAHSSDLLSIINS
ncbi:MAG: dipeptidase PepE [FCB group bacterium]|nr:dipeptidase PepE [FCB group bacterium]